MLRMRPAPLPLVVLLVVAAALGATAAAPATAGARAELDRTFLRDGTHRFSAFTDRAHAVLVSGGRIFATADDGSVTAVTGGGRTDEAYGRAGIGDAFDLPGRPALDVFALAGGLVADPRPGDPRAVISGAMLGVAGLAVARLHGDGSLDTTWGPPGPLFFGGAYVYPADDIVRDPLHPGRIFAAARRDTNAGCPVTAGWCGEYDVVRLDERGRPDPTWGAGGTVRIPLPAVTAPGAAPGDESRLSVAPDGSLSVLMQGAYGYPVAPPLRLIRISPAGLIAAVVTLPALPDEQLVQPDGQGGFYRATGYHTVGTLTHVLGDGSTDPVLARVPLRGLSSVTAVLRTRDGLVVVGSVRRGIRNTPRLLRLDAQGRPDPSFGTRGLLTVSFRSVKIAQLLSAVTEDPDGRLVLAGSVGDLYTDIREDYGPTHLGLMRVRTRPPDLDLTSARVAVDARGVGAVRVRCSVHTCPGARIDVRRGNRLLGVAGFAGMLAGRRRSITIHLGPLGRRLARRHAAVDVRITPPKDPVRRQETDPVLRAARLVVAR